MRNKIIGKQKRDFENGFTLLELLVVIAIISILATFLFPVFSNARASARSTQDLNQLKQVAMGIIMYADQNDGFSVPLKTDENPSKLPGTNYPGGYGWPLSVLGYVGSKEIFCSPSDPGIKKFIQKMAKNASSDPGAQEAPLRGHYVSWGYNWKYLSPRIGGKYAPHKLDNIEDPSATILLANSTAKGVREASLGSDDIDCGYFRIEPPSEASFWTGMGAVNEVSNKKPNAKLYGGLWPRHQSGEKCNVAFVDGHVKSLSLKDIVRAPSSSDPEWLWQTRKGEFWQGHDAQQQVDTEQQRKRAARKAKSRPAAPRRRLPQT